MKFASPQQFADALSISKRAAQMAFARGSWRQHTLPLVELDGNVGGASGRVRNVVVSALPRELRTKFETASKAVQTPVEALVEGQATDEATALASWRWSIIRDVYGMTSNPAKTAEVERTTSQRHYFEGKDMSVSKTTLYGWMKRYADGGFGALASEGRADRGKRRVQISRNWDKRIDLDQAAQERIGLSMDAYAKSFVRSDGSLRKLAHIGTRRLVEMCQQEGSEIPAPELTKLCKLNSKWTTRFAEFKRVARKERDAKLHFDRDQPRIAGHGPAMPGEVIFGDVHPVDLWVTEDDRAGQIRVRLIAWQDACTHMLHVTPLLFRKGRGARQSDIIDSFYDLNCNPHCGLGGTYYLDNGGEYGSLFGSFQRFPDLSNIVPGRGVVKAKPYNGPAKGLIEGAFASAER